MNRSDEFRDRARRAAFRRFEIENRVTSQRLERCHAAYVAAYGPRDLMASEIDLSVERANRTPDSGFGFHYAWSLADGFSITPRTAAAYSSAVRGTSIKTRCTGTSMALTNPRRFLDWYEPRLLARQTAASIADRRVATDYAAALVEPDYVTGHALADVDRVPTYDTDGLVIGTRYAAVARDTVPDWYQYLKVKPHATRAVKVFKHTHAVTTARVGRSVFPNGTWRVFATDSAGTCEVVRTYRLGEIDRVANWSTSSRGYGPGLEGYVNVVNVSEDVYLASSRDPGGYCRTAAMLNRRTADVFREAGEHMPSPDAFNVRRMRYQSKPDTVAFRGVARWVAGSPVRVEHGAKKVDGKLVANLADTHRGVDGQYELRTALVMDRTGIAGDEKRGWLGHRYVTFAPSTRTLVKKAEHANGERQALETGTRKGPHVTAFGLSKRSLLRAEKRVILEANTLTILAQSLSIGQGVRFDNGVVITSLGAQVIHHDMRGGARAWPLRDWAIRAALAGMASIEREVIDTL